MYFLAQEHNTKHKYRTPTAFALFAAECCELQYSIFPVITLRLVVYSLIVSISNITPINTNTCLLQPQHNPSRRFLYRTFFLSLLAKKHDTIGSCVIFQTLYLCRVGTANAAKARKLVYYCWWSLLLVEHKSKQLFAVYLHSARSTLLQDTNKI